MTAQQHSDLPEDEDVTAADRLIVDSPTMTGLILVRAMGPEPGLRPMARRALSGAQCRRRNGDEWTYFVTSGGTGGPAMNSVPAQRISGASAASTASRKRSARCSSASDPPAP